MATGKQEFQTDQMVNEAALAVMRQAARTDLSVLFPAIDQNFGSPFRMYASNPASAVLNIAAQEIQRADGVGQSAPPTSSTIPTVPASTINFQTGATTGATFSGLTFPSTTVGQFRRLGLTLVASGQITAIWSAAAATLAATANPGTLFVPGGVPIGWIDLVATASTAFKTAGSATSIIENSVSGTSTIHIFGSGGSGGSGTGDANSFLEALLCRLNDSYFNRLSKNIFAQDGTTLVDPTSTATYDIAASPQQYDFTASSQVLKSLELFTAGFFANSNDVGFLEMIAEWGVADTGALYEVTVDGGLNWNTITMSEIDVTNRYRGRVKVAAPTTTSTLWQFPSSNADSVETFDASSEQSQAIKFDSAVASGAKKKSTQVTVYINKLGSPTGYLSARIVKDSAGLPSTAVTDLIASSSVQLISSLSAGNNTVQFSFNGILPAGNYWLVLDVQYQGSYSVGVNQISWQTDNSSPTYTGTYAKYNGSAWSTIATKKPCFVVTGVPYSLISRITSSTSTGKINGYGLFYEDSGPYQPQQPNGLYETSFSGDSDTTSFTLTFLPDPKRLVVFELTGTESRIGRAYMYPAFSLSGQTVTFPSGTFVDPGQTKQLRFWQISGSGFDNSDSNRALMAANHLGSSDGTIDQSIAGRGIVLRRPDGTLREITIDNNDNISILSVP